MIFLVFYLIITLIWYGACRYKQGCISALMRQNRRDHYPVNYSLYVGVEIKLNNQLVWWKFVSAFCIFWPITLLALIGWYVIIKQILKFSNILYELGEKYGCSTEQLKKLGKTRQ